MIDGLDVPASVARGGTNPTSLIQAGNLEIGTNNGGTQFLNGKIAQVAIYSAKVTQANIKATISQGLTGSETSLASAYSFNNSINDLNTTNANNLTANGSAVATNADSCFTNAVTGTSVTAGTTNYGIITAQTFSTNTTYTVQIPEGETLPTTGGIGALSYSTQKTPYGFPGARVKWQLITLSKGDVNNGASTGDQYYNVNSFQMSTPIGSYVLKATITAQTTTSAGAARGVGIALATSAGNFSNLAKAVTSYVGGTGDARGTSTLEINIDNTVATVVYVNLASLTSTATALYLIGSADTQIIVENAYL
jgi:hypothetical protein